MRGLWNPTGFDEVFALAGIGVIRTGARAPRQNTVMERWFRSVRAELADRTLIWSISHLMRLLREYEAFHRNHGPGDVSGETRNAMTSAISSACAASASRVVSPRAALRPGVAPSV